MSVIRNTVEGSQLKELQQRLLQLESENLQLKLNTEFNINNRNESSSYSLIDDIIYGSTINVKIYIVPCLFASIFFYCGYILINEIMKYKM